MTNVLTVSKIQSRVQRRGRKRTADEFMIVMNSKKNTILPYTTVLKTASDGMSLRLFKLVLTG